ncbi:MAG: Squalene/phytoene synthase, partial [Bryobacterales bacterium]|nr:Squalene/phytoene synthase [Bryobacterales bacterium]
SGFPLPVAQLQPKDYVRTVELAHARYSEAESLEYTRWLATHHYENFQVVSFLLPKALHQDFYNVYAFCRWADDLGDEIDDAQESLSLLAWWREELRAMYSGQAAHPVFVALKTTVECHEIPIEPFDRLIRAFEQDQTVTRYPGFDDVFGYCVNSANPVGHLVLYLCGYRDVERQRLSDFTCTALQLANFWQDVTVDLHKDRVYLPLQLLAEHNYTVEELFALRFDGRFERLMRQAVDVADDLFHKGLPLIGTVNRRLALDLELFSRGGMKILDKIRAQGYDVLKSRPKVTKAERVALMLRCLPRLLPF